MTKEELKKLFSKYNDGTATEEERALLEAWYLQYNEKEPYQLSRKNIQAVKNEIFRRLPGNQGQFFKIGIRLAAAAVLIGILFAVTLLFFVNHRPCKSSALAYDLPPGTNKAVLTLANGKQLNLSDASNGHLYQQQGVKIIKSQSGQVVFDYSGDEAVAEQNTITTPNGGQWRIKLPDGSQVWLNAASSLTFPTSFHHSVNRIVKLSGEGYFEVAKDATHPFIVISGNQQVEVLGTHFNINSYPDEPAMKTTLLEGRVKVSLPGHKNDRVLEPGKQAVVTSNGIEINNVDTDVAIAWKQGDFRFDAEPVSSAMRKLARWYNVEVQYQGQVKDEKIDGIVSRNKNISQVIKALEATKTVHFKLEGRRITVMK
ncbi:MAG: FecR family protein [Mucilaginibacter sp.]